MHLYPLNIIPVFPLPFPLALPLAIPLTPRGGPTQTGTPGEYTCSQSECSQDALCFDRRGAAMRECDEMGVCSSSSGSASSSSAAAQGSGSGDGSGSGGSGTSGSGAGGFAGWRPGVWEIGGLVGVWVVGLGVL
ncbi:hypothetical protein BO78DRAFT_387883 [Aspergillus sclerotiicarbonarius CBS 121057]|uniref:Uncharacterized protein n=1 Tax=Aspergillus sclerotiicarbonarius (strain CBS 121057 / IBT 28362) TaxID=1448318 RepID=A0A319EFB6_ASPSB|nr:hypothetical protein BO78DRAFT_387883 [Aspergillus sclerotiicarbonarius CBS 121057]